MSQQMKVRNDSIIRVDNGYVLETECRSRYNYRWFFCYKGKHIVMEGCTSTLPPESCRKLHSKNICFNMLNFVFRECLCGCSSIVAVALRQVWAISTM